MAVAAPAPSPAQRALLRRAAWLVPLGVVSYGLRFVSSWLVVNRARDTRFDPHGFGLLGDAMSLLAAAPLILALLGWVLWRRRPWRGLLAPAATSAATALSAVLLVLLGAPLPGQVWALVLLPASASWPVLVSVLFWFATVAVGRAIAVARARAPMAVPGAQS